MVIPCLAKASMAESLFANFIVAQQGVRQTIRHGIGFNLICQHQACLPPNDTLHEPMAMTEHCAGCINRTLRGSRKGQANFLPEPA